MFWKEATKDYADVFCDSVHFYFVTWRTYSSMLVLSFVCVLLVSLPSRTIEGVGLRLRGARQRITHYSG